MIKENYKGRVKHR